MYYIQPMCITSASMSQVFEKRLGLGSETNELAECGQLKVVKLERWSTGATHQRIMEVTVPCWSFDKNTAIAGKWRDIQSRERAEPHIRRHGVLGPVPGIQVGAKDRQLDVTIIVKLKHLV